MDSGNKLFLLDAYALIYRAYYAFIKNPRINSKGFNTSAILGFCNTLKEILDKENPAYMGVAFDKGKTFRHEAFPAYKAQRSETPEDIKLAVPYIQEILKALNIPILQVDGFEADDVIGTLARSSAAADRPVIISTGDKDMAQLVDGHITLVNTMTGSSMDVEGVKEKFGVAPEQIIDYLALMGDSSDNIPGVPGVGDGFAAKWINQYGGLEQIIEHADEISGKKG